MVLDCQWMVISKALAQMNKSQIAQGWNVGALEVAE